MYFVYILKSTTKKWVYVGITNNLEIRLNAHSKGLVKSTKHYKPFQLIFVQMMIDRKEARDLETFLKVRWNKESLLDLIDM